MELRNETIGGANYVKIEHGKYKLSISTAGDSSNCKLSYIHQAGNLSQLTDAEKKEVLDFALKGLKGCVIINTIDENVALFIQKTYPTYYYQEVPIGYNNGFQYHVSIKNPINVNDSCKDPKDVKPKKGDKVKEVIKEVIKEVVVEKEVIKEVPVIKRLNGYSRKRVERDLKEFTKKKKVPEEFVTDFIEHLSRNVVK